MAQWEKNLPCKYDRILDSNTCNLSSQEGETGDSPASWVARLAKPVSPGFK